jgi:hypothetical protein
VQVTLAVGRHFRGMLQHSTLGFHCFRSANTNILAGCLLDSQWCLRHLNGRHNCPSSIVSRLVPADVLEKKRCGHSSLWKSSSVRYAFSTTQDFFASINLLTKPLELSLSQLGESGLSLQTTLMIKPSKCITAT